MMALINSNIEDPVAEEILIVDDTQENLILLENLLRNAGYEVRAANTAKLALRSVALKHPSLILLDIRMPEMDGYEVCQLLKSDPETRSIPIIFISILEHERDKVKGFQVGAVDYINKPFHAEEVLARVNTHLMLQRMQKDLEHRNRELRDAHDNLENKVKERTLELERTNEKLQQEIDSHQETLQMLKESEQRYRQIVDTANEGIFILDKESRILFANDQLAKMVGYQREEMTGVSTNFLLFDEDLFDHERKLDARRHGMPDHYERRFRRKDGTALWALVSAVPLFNSKGEFNGSFAMITNITGRKKAEEELQKNYEILMHKEQALLESENRNNTLLGAIPDLMCIISHEGLFLDLHIPDKSFESIPFDQILHKNISEIELLSDVKDIFFQAIETAIKTSDLEKFEFSINLAEKVRFYEIRLKALNETELIGIVRDITEQKIMEEKLKKAITQITQNMETFAALNDKIRNPLTIIDSLLDFPDEDMTKKIREEITHIDSIITQLDLGWMHSEKVRIFLMKYFKMY